MDNKLDLVVSFDTTGSMYPVLAQVRQEVESFVKDMFTEFTDLRIGVIAHGDYCDEGDPYTIRVMDLTRDEEKLCRFVRETDKTYGGDADECYELVLNTARKVVNWREDAQHVLIMIGDASPHGVHYPQNKEHLDWEEEAKQLGKEDVKIFSVHALAYYRSSSRGFYKAIAELSGGVYLTLDQFNEIVELIKATCYQQGGEEKLNEYISIIRDNGKMTHSMDRNFRRLKGEEVEEHYNDYSARRSCGMSFRSKAKALDKEVTIKEKGKLVPVMPGRFQTFTVPQNIDIKGYVTSMGIEFKKGRGFYELSKAETVQQYKEVIIQDRETGEMFTGSQVREELGLQPQTVSGGVKERLHKSAAEKYRVFVQSTSVNRKLIAGTTFLYEVSDIDDTGTIIKEEEIMLKDATVESYGIEEEKEVKKSKSSCKKDSKEKTEESKKSKKKSEKKDASKKKGSKKEKSPKGVSSLDKDFEVYAARLVTQFDKVSDAINRYTTSQNKKNTTFAKNNIKKLIELANKLDSKIEE